MYTLRVVPEPEIRKCDAFGDFDVYKDFTVLPPSSSKTASKSSTASKAASKLSPHSPFGIKVKGIIVQCVDKSTTVTDANNTEYNTTEDIKTFTSNKVNFSNDKYLEYFTLNPDATSETGDSFSTGAVVQYDQNGPLSFTTDDPEYNTYKTEGTITMVGENWFISADNKNYNDILAMGWVMQTDATNLNPANGLNYMPYSKGAYDRLKKCVCSNILIHTVVARWTFEDPYTEITSSLKNGLRGKATIISTKAVVPEPEPAQSISSTAAVPEPEPGQSISSTAAVPEPEPVLERVMNPEPKAKSSRKKKWKTRRKTSETTIAASNGGRRKRRMRRTKCKKNPK